MENGIIYLKKRRNSMTKDTIKIKRADHVFSIRFGSAMFLVVLWNKRIYSSAIDQFNTYFENRYPYKLLKPDESEMTLNRVTDSLNCFQPGIIQSKKAMVAADEEIREVLGGINTFETQDQWDQNWSEEKQREGRLLIDRYIFPDNKRIQK
ncbi:hypothetical protein [Paenibacillus pini]|nr:hypothetical protein [Paenibacillus pini]